MHDESESKQPPALRSPSVGPVSARPGPWLHAHLGNGADDFGQRCGGRESDSKFRSPRVGPCCDWPNWRGPRHDGASQETGWNSDAWPVDGLPVLWSREVGVGFSSIAVAAGSCYTMGHEGDDDHVWRLDAEDGHVIWNHAYPSKLVDNLHEGGPAATPTVDGDRVYTVGKEGHFVALAVDDGSPVWTVEFQQEFDVKMPEWGFSCSPLVQGDLVIVDAGCLAAFDKRSGKLAWKTAVFRPGYGSPTPLERAGERLVAVLNNDALLVVRLADGSQVAQFPWKTDYATSLHADCPGRHDLHLHGLQSWLRIIQARRRSTRADLRK